MVSPAEATRILRTEALRQGFHRVGLAPVGEWDRHAFYRRWIASGAAGEMAYLIEEGAARRDPRSLLPGARSILSVALSCHPALDDVPRPGCGRVARYARGTDYHIILKARLRAVVEAASAQIGQPIAALPCVDTAALLEREAAVAAGLGFLGKNTMLIAPGLGSHLLLGELLLDIDTVPDTTLPPRCGDCRRCLDACPTAALAAPYHLDARRCISYLTIELVGAIPRPLRPLVGDWIFGCDLCQDACPYNAADPSRPRDPELSPGAPRRSAPSLLDLLAINASQFRQLVKRSPLRRLHRAQLLRNVAVALGNIGGVDAIDPLGRALGEPHPLIREHAAWALGEISRRTGDGRARDLLARRLSDEPDAAVREEIALALVDDPPFAR